MGRAGQVRPLFLAKSSVIHNHSRHFLRLPETSPSPFVALSGHEGSPNKRLLPTQSGHPGVIEIRALAGDGPASFSAGPENVLDVRVWRPHHGAQSLIIRLPESSAHLPAHVHLDQRELLGILVEVGG